SNRITFRQFYLLYCFPGLCHVFADAYPRHIHINVTRKYAILIANHRRSVDCSDFGEFPKFGVMTSRRRNQQMLKSVARASIVAHVANVDGITFPAAYVRTYIVSAHRAAEHPLGLL